MKPLSVDEMKKVLEIDRCLQNEIKELEGKLRKISLDDDNGYQINEELVRKWKELLDHRNKNNLIFNLN